MIFCISFVVLAAGTACGGEAQPTPPPESSGITSAAPTATSIPPHIPIPAPAVGASTAPGSARPAACPGTAGWGAGTQEATGSTTDALYLVRADRLDCYDRSETDAINVSIREILDVAKVEWGVVVTLANSRTSSRLRA